MKAGTPRSPASQAAGESATSPISSPLEPVAAEWPLIFLHVPKAAGASLRRLLASLYGKNHYWLPPGRQKEALGSLREMTPSQRRRIRAVSGHVQYGVVDRCFDESGLRHVTVLRDPVSRIRSLYQYVLTQPSHPYHEIAQKGQRYFFESDIGEIDNLQARMMSGKAGIRHISESEYEKARENLSTFFLVGVQEAYGDFVDALLFRLNTHQRPLVPDAHVAARKIPIEPGCRSIIEERNIWDIALHREYLAVWKGQ